ncbi:MAG: hypothetical protein ACK4NQ_03160 [Fimbriimonadaceae bacterium]
MNRFLAVVATWLMVLVALAQGGPGGPGGGGQPTLSLVGSSTNWTGNSPATNRFLFPAQLPSIEGFTHPVVYTKGGSAQLQVFFQNNNPQQDFVGNLIVQDARFIHSTPPAVGTPGSPPPVTIPDTILSAPTVSLSVPIGQTSPASLSLGGLPSFVTHGYIQLTMRVEGNFGAQVPGGNPSPWSGTVNTQKVYITLSNPVGVMNPIWTEVAEISCSFAQQSSTLASVNQKLSQGLFDSNLMLYNLSSGAQGQFLMLSSGNPAESVYLLKNFLNQYVAAGRQMVNCYDINGFLIILHECQGIDSVGQKVNEVGEPLFVTNPVCPIGYNRADASYYFRLPFSNHFQCIVSGTLSDSALAYSHDLSGVVRMDVAWAWSVTGAWQTFSIPNVYGLTYRLKLAEDTIAAVQGMPLTVVIVGPTPAQSVGRQATTIDVTSVN